MQPEFHGKINGGYFTLNVPKVFNAYVKGLDDGNYYIVLHKRKGPSKTPEQLGYYYAVIVPTAFKQMKEDGNERMVIRTGKKNAYKFKEVPLTEEVVDLLLKEACAKFDGKIVTLKRNMTMRECSEFIDRAIRWCARYLHCVIPPPEET